jgi:DNA ligase (NAD+)
MSNAQRIADEAYEAGNPIMNDDIYDATFGDISTHEFIKTGQTSTLPIWMGSLDKKRDEKTLNTWLDKTRTDNFVISAKLDGISALYDPENNKLYTRGNGRIGCDISRFIKHLNLDKARVSAKKTLNLMIDAIPECERDQSHDMDVYVRGELIMDKNIFDIKYKNIFKNPRNLVAGQFGKKTINVNIISDISFIPYEVIISGLSTQCPASEQLQNTSIPWIEMKRSNMSIGSLTQLLNDWIRKSVFEMDGLVVTEDRMYTRNTSGNPKYSIAFKKEINLETAVTTVTKITWDISRWGLLKPVVNIEPVQLSGVTIKKCSGHNAKYILDNKIGPGAQIVCVRSGDVIPYIVSVVKPTDNMTLPGSTWNGVDLQAEDENDEAIEIKTLINFFSKMEVKYISTKTIEKMYTDCGLNTLFKMINCSKNDLQPVFKDKSADRIITGLNDMKNRKLKVSSVVGASGVLGFGLGAKRVENLFASLPTLRSGDWGTVPTVEDVRNVAGFDKMAENVVLFFPKMTLFIKMCSDNGLQFEEAENDERCKIALSGFRDKDLENKYNVLSSVTKECDILVCKSFEKDTEKMKKARKLGVKMVLLTDFK